MTMCPRFAEPFLSKFRNLACGTLLAIMASIVLAKSKNVLKDGSTSPQKERNSATTKKRKRGPELLELLPDSLLVEIAGWLLGDARDVVCFQRSNKRVHKLLNGEQTSRQLLRNYPIHHRSVTFTTLEELGFYQVICKMGLFEENRVGFDYATIEMDDDSGQASGVDNSETRVRKLKHLLQSKRFPSFTIAIHAHCGVGAPPGVAPRFSAARGHHVASCLIGEDEEEQSGFMMHYEADESGRISVHFLDDRQTDRTDLRRRIEVNAWGRRVSNIVQNLSHPYSTVANDGRGWAELYVQLGDLELPPKPDYYDGLYTV